MSHGSNGSIASIDNLDKKLRHSLQPKEAPKVPQSSLRLSQSQRRNETKKKKAIVLPPIKDINEDGEELKETRIDVRIEREREKERRASRRSEISLKAAQAYDNAAFEQHSDRISRGGSSGAPSVQSLEIVREQYCCCARRTPCERKLIFLVLVLLIVIIVLAVVLSVVLAKGEMTPLNHMLRLR